jgi:hypothetical protein
MQRFIVILALIAIGCASVWFCSDPAPSQQRSGCWPIGHLITCESSTGEDVAVTCHSQNGKTYCSGRIGGVTRCFVDGKEVSC